MTALADMPQRHVLTIEEAAKVLRIGRSAAYSGARRGDIPTIRVGRCLRVPRHRLEEMLGPDNEHEPATNGLVSKGDPDHAPVEHPCEP